MQNEEFNQSGKAHSGRTLPRCDFLHLVAFVVFCSNLFHSVLLFLWLREIWRQSSSEFARLHPTSIKFAFLNFVLSNFRVFVIRFDLQFAESEIRKRITKARKHEKCSALCERSRDPAPTRPHPQVKQRTIADQSAPCDGCGGDPFELFSELSKINCRRQILISEIQASHNP